MDGEDAQQGGKSVQDSRRSGSGVFDEERYVAEVLAAQHRIIILEQMVAEQSKQFAAQSIQLEEQSTLRADLHRMMANWEQILTRISAQGISPDDQ